MKKLILVGLLLLIAIPALVYAGSFSSVTFKDSVGSTDITATNASGTLTFSGITAMDLGSATLTATGTPSWSLTNDQYVDDGVTDSPKWGMRDASDEDGYLYKINSSHLVIYNDTAADGIAMQAGGDTDDYALFTTTTNVPYITTVGSCVLGLKPSDDLYIMPDSETDDYISFASSGTQITMGIVGGADLIITHDTDAKGIAFEMGNDTDDYLTLYTTGNEPTFATSGSCDLNFLTASAEINLKGPDADDYISIGASSNVPQIKANGCTQIDILAGDADDYASFTSAANVPGLTITGSCDFAFISDNASSQYVDLTNMYLRMADDEYITNASDVVAIYSDDNDAYLDLVGYEAKASGIIFTADQGDDAKDRWKILAADSATGTLTISNDSAVADTFVSVATFSALGDMSLVGTTPVLTIGDGGAEDTGIVFDGVADWYMQVDDTGGIAEDMLTIGNGSTVGTTPVLGITSAGVIYAVNTDATANAVEDILVIRKETSGASANGIGAGVVFQVEDGGNTEEQASLDVTMTDNTNDNEEADIIFSQNSAGAIGETLRLVAAKSATTGDYLKFTSNTTETNGVIDVLYLTESAVVGASGNGLAVTMNYCDAGGAELQGRMSNVLTDATNGSEDSDWIFSQQLAGAIEERVKFDADGYNVLAIGTTPGIGIGDAGAEDTILAFLGNAQTYYVGLDDAGTYADSLVLGLGAAVGTTPAMAIDANQNVQFVQNVLIKELNFAADAEASDTYVITLAPAPTAYTTGMMIIFTANTANTGACTVNVNGLGAKSLKMLHDQDPGNNYIESGSVVMAVYDGTNFQMMQPAAN